MASYRARIREFEDRVLRETLAATGTVSGAARVLGLQRTYLSRLLKERGIPKPAPRTGANATAPCTR